MSKTKRNLVRLRRRSIARNASGDLGLSRLLQKAARGTRRVLDLDQMTPRY